MKCPIPASDLWPATQKQVHYDKTVHHLNASWLTLGLATWTHLIFQSHFGGQNIICVPLLVQSQAQILHFVLGLQVSSRFSSVCVTGAAGGELLRNQRETQWTDAGKEKKNNKRGRGRFHRLTGNEEGWGALGCISCS